MDSRKINVFIKKAKLRLVLQETARALQIALCLGLASALLIIGVARLSVLPYYEFYAYTAAAITVLSVVLLKLKTIPGRREAISELDRFTPDNQLLTLSQIPAGSSLAEDLCQKAEKDIHLSYQVFKRMNNKWILYNWSFAAIFLMSLLALAILFPATAQLEAKNEEREAEIVEEMIEQVEEQIELADSPELKKELEALEEKLNDSTTPEQALRELVKKQKELALKEQKKNQEDTAEATREAKELGEASQQLAMQAGKTQTALSEIGKPVAFDLQQSIAANNRSGGTGEDAGSESAPGSGEDAGESSDAETGGTQSESDSAENTEKSNDGKADGQSGSGSEAAGEGSGQSGEESEGADSGGGDGGGQDSGEGDGSNPGTGAGTGEGSREMLSIPSRIGGSGETTVDTGELSEGESGSFQEGAVDAERGTVRSYRDIVGDYSGSYFSSAERLKLPPDLQNIVEQYFSAIDSQ